MKPICFTSQSDLRKWFEKNHDKEKELLAGYYKVATGKPTITWSQSVDEALCFGWIDGIRRSVDEESYCIRFTPRNPKSNWSTININKVKKLLELGLMKPEGITAFNLRKEEKLKIYSYENVDGKFSNPIEKQFKTNKAAWKNYKSMPPSYQKIAIRWVMSAKQEATRIKRLNILITDSEAVRKIKPLNYGKK